MSLFQKKNPIMEEKKEIPVTKRGIKKMDAIVTGALLWGVVASLYGVKKLQGNTSEAHSEKTPAPSEEKEIKKPGFFRRIFGKK